VADLTYYSFRSVWHIDADSEVIFEVLGDLDDYPSWWPEIKHVTKTSPHRVATCARSFLPYKLEFEMEQARREPHSGVLEVRMTGDLEGFARWTVTPQEGGSRLLFEEEVHTNKKVLNRLAPLARFAFNWNHRFMMRHGQAGLRTYMAGFRRAQRSSE
jgi:hypothetical protein